MSINSATRGKKVHFRAEKRERDFIKKTKGSAERFQRASRSLAGGVSSSLRRSARPYPLYFSDGCGSRLNDVDGNQYIDFGLGWGPNILGNAPIGIASSLTKQVTRGLTYGAQHDYEFEVAEKLVKTIPCADLVCFANSGTEIVQVALRLARAATGRRLSIKFEGHYHGWADNVLVSYHPSISELKQYNGQPIPTGIGQLPSEHFLVAQWNDRRSVEQLFTNYPDDISSVICEPLLCNSGCIPPEPGFLEFLEEIAAQHGALLIFDEVITGFRLGLGGAQEFYGVIPDLATYGKAVGAGTPLSILAGRKKYMDLIADGRVIHAGTLNGNPLALAAAKVSLDYLSQNGVDIYPELHRIGNRLRDGLESILRTGGYTVITTGEGPAFQLSFMSEQPRNYRETMAADKSAYSDFAIGLLDEGVLVLPDGRWYISTAHTDQNVDETLTSVERVVG